MSQHPDSFAQHVHAMIAAHLTPAAVRKDETRVLYYMNEMYRHALRNAFNAAANPHHSQPAIETARRHGLRDVSGDYTLPRGLSAPVLETYFMVLRHMYLPKNTPAQARTYLHDVLSRIETLNPQLATLSYDRNDVYKCYDVLMGVTSGFHTDDIQHYLDGNFYKKSMENPAYAAKHSAVVAHLNDNQLYWVPSPKTLDRILAQKPRQP